MALVTQGWTAVTDAEVAEILGEWTVLLAHNALTLQQLPPAVRRLVCSRQWLTGSG